MCIRDSPDTCLVTIMYANNEIGSIQPIAEIGAVCKEKGVYFHTDAVQAVGHLSINVKEQNIDMMSASAHKFHGPKGVGFFYARKGILLSNIIEGGAQAVSYTHLHSVRSDTSYRSTPNDLSDRTECT